MSNADMADPYVRPSKSGMENQGSFLWLLFIAFILVGAAVALSILKQETVEPFVLGFLALLSIVGVVLLFGLALGFISFGRKAQIDLRSELIDSLDDGILVTDHSNSILYANPSYRRMTDSKGGSVPISVERAFAIYPEASEPMYRLMQATQESRDWHEEFRVGDDEDEEVGWFRVAVRSIPGFGGHFSDKPCTIWRIAEVTYDRARQEDIYKELQAAIDYLDHAPAGFFSTSQTGRIRYMNATLASWLGYDLTQMPEAQLRLADIVSGEADALLSQSAPKAGEVRTTAHDLDLLRRDGTPLPVRLLHKVSFGTDDQSHHSRTLVLNRSAGEESAEDLRAAQVRFARFFNSAPIAIASIDRAGRVIRNNAIFARLQDSLKLKGENIRLDTFFKEEDRLKSKELIEATVANRQVDSKPVDLGLAGEGERSVRLFMAPVERDETDEDGAIAYIIDTSEQSRLQAQFAQSQKMNAVGQLAGGIAHDFNNVLTAIIGYSDLLLTTHRATDPAFQDIMNIKQNANRAAGLVRQLLAFSRRQTLLPEVLQLNSVLGDLLVMLRRLLGEKIELTVDKANDLWLVKVDLIQLEQVIINLCVNARDAMADGGRLTITTSNVHSADFDKLDYEGIAEGDYVQVDITDTGTGMPPDVVEKIFEPFFTTKEVGKGTGLGLSTVYGIIKQTGGFIYPISVVGEGTTFRIFLPRHIPSAKDNVEDLESVDTVEGIATSDNVPKSAAKGKEEDLQDLTGQATILLVEDEDAVRAFSSRALIARGYTVLEAPSGLDALTVIEEHDGMIDLVVSDVVMPEMDGPTMLKELRKTHPDTKIIFISGYAEDAFQKNLDEDEQFDFLPKPFNLKQLAAKVKEVLEK